MRTVLARMVDTPGFLDFLVKLKTTAGYRMATADNAKPFDRKSAVDLCVAAAYEAGVASVIKAVEEIENCDIRGKL